MIVFYIILIIIGVISFYVILPWIIKLFIKYRTAKKLKEGNISCLTFDDGPHPEATPKILELLDGVGIKATFFVLGKKVEEYPEIAKKIVDKGHEIANHSYYHNHAWKSGPFKTIKDLIKSTKVLRKYLTGNQVKLLRPPFGKLNLMSILYALFTGNKLIFWNLDSLDYTYNSAAELREEFVPNVKSGQIILLHDGRSTNGGNVNDANITVEALESLLKNVDTKGIKFTTVGKALFHTR